MNIKTKRWLIASNHIIARRQQSPIFALYCGGHIFAGNAIKQLHSRVGKRLAVDIFDDAFDAFMNQFGVGKQRIDVIRPKLKESQH